MVKGLPFSTPTINFMLCGAYIHIQSTPIPTTHLCVLYVGKTNVQGAGARGWRWNYCHSGLLPVKSTVSIGICNVENFTCRSNMTSHTFVHRKSEMSYRYTLWTLAANQHPMSYYHYTNISFVKHFMQGVTSEANLCLPILEYFPDSYDAQKTLILLGLTYLVNYLLGNKMDKQGK